MSWRDAPLYIHATDLAQWCVQRASGWSGPLGDRLGRDLHAAALELVDQVALALTFPSDRAAHLAAADATVVRLRERLRLAQCVGLLSADQHRFACERLAEAGRMIGGWRKRLDRRAREPPGARAPQ